LENKIELHPISMSEFTSWIKGILLSIIDFLQNISAPLFWVLFGFGAIVLVVGILLGSNRMRGAGGGTMILCLICYLIVKKIDTIYGVINGFIDKAPK